MAIGTLVGHFARNWGWVVLRGVIAILFGVVALLMPGITLALLVLVWGAYAIADGVLSLVAAFRIRDEGRPMWPLVLIGLVGIAAGIATFMWPGLTALLLLATIAIWAVVTGVLQIAAAIRLRKVIENEWWMGLAGLLSIVFGVFMLARPGAGALAVVWLIAWYAILFGATLLMLGFRLKGLAARLPKPA